MKDKRDECGCHRECVVYSHVCDKPCIWPGCLNLEEEKEVLEDLRNTEGIGY